MTPIKVTTSSTAGSGAADGRMRVDDRGMRPAARLLSSVAVTALMLHARPACASASPSRRTAPSGRVYTDVNVALISPGISLDRTEKVSNASTDAVSGTSAKSTASENERDELALASDAAMWVGAWGEV